MNLSDFLHMGGYALYVWSSYALALLVLVINLILPLRGRSQILRALQRAQHLEARRKA